MRVSVYIVMFLVFFNGGALMLQSTGAADWMGIDPAEGNDEQIKNATEAAKNPNPGRGIGETLFGMYNSLAGTLETVFNTVMPGAAMLKAVIHSDAGDAFINYIFTAAPIIVGLDTIAFFRGWDLV